MGTGNFSVATRSLVHAPHRVDACELCAVRNVAACAPLSPYERRRLTPIMTTLGLGAQRLIFSEGEPAIYVFTLTVGMIKIYKRLPDGRRQITGFLFPGDFLGLVDNRSYAYSAETLTGSKLCRFQREKLEMLLSSLPKLERRLLGMASHEIAAAQDRMMLLGRKTARERVASFLVMLSNAGAGTGDQSGAIAVPMSRSDIADYLGLTMETVSRCFGDFRKRQLIEMVDGKRVCLLDAAALQRVAAGS